MLTGEPFKLIKLKRTAHQRMKIPCEVYAAVSPEDFGWLQEYRWSLNISGIKRLYAYTSILEKGAWRYMGMHRLIVMRSAVLAADDIADHRNGYTLDNRRCNLRPASESPFESLSVDEPFPAPYAPPTGPTLPPGADYYYNQEYGVWRMKEQSNGRDLD